MAKEEQTQDSRPKTQDKKKETQPRTLVSGNDEQVDEQEVTEPKATESEKTEPEVIGPVDEPEVEKDKTTEQTTDSRPKTQDEKKKTKKSARWHFPNALQCPRCRSYDTVATSTKVNKQYRTCRRGHCRHRYCVTGVKEKKSR